MALGQTLHLDYDCRFQEYRLYAGVLIDGCSRAIYGIVTTTSPTNRTTKIDRSRLAHPVFRGRASLSGLGRTSLLGVRCAPAHEKRSV